MSDTRCQLLNKKVVVTGASSGIGRAVALKFGQAGAQVSLIARREERLKELKKEIEDAGGQAHVIVADLQDVAQITQAFAMTRKVMGDPHVLVNNAGMAFPSPVTESTREQYEQTFNLNVRALWMGCQEVLPAMIKAKEGTIINIGTICGKIGMANLSLYCASKFAVTGFSEALLEEVREHNIKVSVICPGLVKTEFHDRRSRPPRGDPDDYIQPEDIADAAFLCASSSQTATLKEIIVRPRRPVR